MSEDAGFAILRLVANSTARFPYNVTVTTADGTATGKVLDTCTYMSQIVSLSDEYI